MLSFALYNGLGRTFLSLPLFTICVFIFHFWLLYFSMYNSPLHLLLFSPVFLLLDILFSFLPMSLSYSLPLKRSIPHCFCLRCLSTPILCLTIFLLPVILSPFFLSSSLSLLPPTTTQLALPRFDFNSDHTTTSSRTYTTQYHSIGPHI